MEVACPMCTFKNEPNVLTCAICYNLLTSMDFDISPEINEFDEFDKKWSKIRRKNTSSDIYSQMDNGSKNDTNTSSDIYSQMDNGSKNDTNTSSDIYSQMDNGSKRALKKHARAISNQMDNGSKRQRPARINSVSSIRAEKEQHILNMKVYFDNAASDKLCCSALEVRDIAHKTIGQPVVSTISFTRFDCSLNQDVPLSLVLLRMKASDFLVFFNDGELDELVSRVFESFPGCQLLMFIEDMREYLKDIEKNEYDDQMRNLSARVVKYPSFSQLEKHLISVYYNYPQNFFFYFIHKHEFPDFLCRVVLTEAEKPYQKDSVLENANQVKRKTIGVFSDDCDDLFKSFVHMLLLIPGISLAQANAVIKIYPSLSLLMEAYSLVPLEKDRRALLMDAKLSDGRRLGEKASEKISRFFLSEDEDGVF